MRKPVFHSHTTADVLSELQSRLIASGETRSDEMAIAMQEVKEELKNRDEAIQVSELLHIVARKVAAVCAPKTEVQKNAD